MTIDEEVKQSGKDIYTFLADKYNTERAGVKALLFQYAYMSNLNESFKFEHPETPYEQMVNDFIDYELSQLKKAPSYVKPINVSTEGLLEVKVFKFPEVEELEQAYKACRDNDLNEYPSIQFVPEFTGSQLVPLGKDKFLILLYKESQFEASPFIARCLVAETDAFEGTLHFDCRAQVEQHFGITTIEKTPLLRYLYRVIEEGPVMIHSIKSQQV
jgi:hypothetical protein